MNGFDFDFDFILKILEILKILIQTINPENPLIRLILFKTQIQPKNHHPNQIPSATTETLKPIIALRDLTETESNDFLWYLTESESNDFISPITSLRQGLGKSITSNYC